jgi:hypothetical protein
MGNEAAQIGPRLNQPVFAEGDNQDGRDGRLEEGVTANGAAEELDAAGENRGIRLCTKAPSRTEHHQSDTE